MYKILVGIGKEYLGIWRTVSSIYKIYDIRTIIFSPFFHLSLLIAYFASMSKNLQDVLDTMLVVIAIYFSFSISGLTIIISLTNEKFALLQKAIEEKEAERLFLKIQASIIHFVIIQNIALIVTLLNKFIFNSIESLSYYTLVFGIFLFIYSILLGFAVIHHIFRYSEIWFRVMK